MITYFELKKRMDDEDVTIIMPFEKVTCVICVEKEQKTKLLVRAIDYDNVIEINEDGELLFGYYKRWLQERSM